MLISYFPVRRKKRKKEEKEERNPPKQFILSRPRALTYSSTLTYATSSGGGAAEARLPIRCGGDGDPHPWPLIGAHLVRVGFCGWFLPAAQAECPS